MSSPDSFSIGVNRIIKSNITTERVYVPDEKAREKEKVRQLYLDQFHQRDFDGFVSGRIVSAEDGEWLPGVNVIVKGTDIGTVTNIEGEYQISIPHGSVLVYSFIGMMSKEVEVGNRTYIDVSLASDVQQLSEVVVSAFGIERRQQALGYSISEISTNHLAGRVAGVAISGSPGASSTIRIRGASTISGENKPIYVIDGILYEGDEYDLGANNVADVTVLKGAEAAAIYGSQAANGVIIISTKKGIGKSISNRCSSRIRGTRCSSGKLIKGQFLRLCLLATYIEHK